jgi:hypothetical protein
VMTRRCVLRISAKRKKLVGARTLSLDTYAQEVRVITLPFTRTHNTSTLVLCKVRESYRLLKERRRLQPQAAVGARDEQDDDE